jgi:hypothetical protein
VEGGRGVLFVRGELDALRRALDLALRASAFVCERSTIEDAPRVVERRCDAPMLRQRAAIGRRAPELPFAKTCATVVPAHARSAREELRMT